MTDTSDIDRLARAAAKQLSEEMNPRADYCGDVYEFDGGLYCDVDGSVDLGGLIRAILHELREPSEGMVEAGEGERIEGVWEDSDGLRHDYTDFDAEQVWRAMIAHILNEGESA